MTLLFSFAAYSQNLSRGPDIGEIYFMGPTATVLYQAIYYSTNSGETAICVDSVSALSNFIEAITADKTEGGLYFVTMGEALYYSGNYGHYGSWEFKHGFITSPMRSGVTEGYFYKHIASHSENYGENFISHSINGFFGSGKDIAIDINQGTCYCLSELYGVNDTLYFFISNDNFENLELQHKFNIHWSNNIILSRDNISGSIFLCNSTLNEILFSNDYGETWQLKNKLSCPNLPIKGMTGGRLDGEIYLMVEYLQLMGQRRHIYIYHSLDYGETFTVYHPISIGPDPIYANFTAEDTLVEPNDIVQFTDLSNDAETWEWDFDNDGTIDSYEQNPTYAYSDTGYYSVKLSITGSAIQDYGIRYNYIHVKNLVGFDEQKCESQLEYYPNPFNDHISIETRSDFKRIEIYDINGKSYFTKTQLRENKTEIIDLKDLEKGIYVLKIKTEGKDITKKIIKI